MNNTPVSIRCPYCHRYTSLTIAPGYTSHRYERQTIVALWQKSSSERWWIGICNCCQKAVLVYEYVALGIGGATEKRNIYPYPLPSPTDKRIPDYIRKDIDEAKLCFSVGAFRACAVMARRAIENACIDKGASKNKKLHEKINELAEMGIITEDIKEWADVVRWIGNDAAHPGKEIVTKEDAEDILKLAEQFMHVIYVAPAIAREQRKKRGK